MWCISSLFGVYIQLELASGFNIKIDIQRVEIQYGEIKNNI